MGLPSLRAFFGHPFLRRERSILAKLTMNVATQVGLNPLFLAGEKKPRQLLLRGIFEAARGAGQATCVGMLWPVRAMRFCASA